jgi:hypothetical protein
VARHTAKWQPSSLPWKGVKADGLLDLYTNRPFGKVFEAIDAVGNRSSLFFDPSVCRTDEG